MRKFNHWFIPIPVVYSYTSGSSRDIISFAYSVLMVCWGYEQVPMEGRGSRWQVVAATGSPLAGTLGAAGAMTQRDPWTGHPASPRQGWMQDTRITLAVGLVCPQQVVCGLAGDRSAPARAQLRALCSVFIVILLQTKKKPSIPQTAGTLGFGICLPARK